MQAMSNPLEAYVAGNARTQGGYSQYADRPRWEQLPVRFPPMGDTEDENLQYRIVNLRDDTMVANTDSPPVTLTRELDRP